MLSTASRLAVATRTKGLRVSLRLLGVDDVNDEALLLREKDGDRMVTALDRGPDDAIRAYETAQRGHESIDARDGSLVLEALLSITGDRQGNAFIPSPVHSDIDFHGKPPCNVDGASLRSRGCPMKPLTSLWI